jgi:steroid Delta-isomerase
MYNKLAIILSIFVSTHFTIPANAQLKETKQMTTSASLTEAQVMAAVARYFEGTRSMNAQQWASAFAPNAEVRDPIGAPALTTPEAILAQGEAFVTAFASVGLTEVFVQAHGNEAMAYWTGRGTQKDGACVVFEGINHFTFDADRKITQLRGFWNPATMRPQ